VPFDSETNVGAEAGLTEGGSGVEAGGGSSGSVGLPGSGCGGVWMEDAGRSESGRPGALLSRAGDGITGTLDEGADGLERVSWVGGMVGPDKPGGVPAGGVREVEGRGAPSVAAARTSSGGTPSGLSTGSGACCGLGGMANFVGAESGAAAKLLEAAGSLSSGGRIAGMLGTAITGEGDGSTVEVLRCSCRFLDSKTRTRSTAIQRTTAHAASQNRVFRMNSPSLEQGAIGLAVAGTITRPRLGCLRRLESGGSSND